ncbi:TorF family putative porin [Sphingomonas sp. ID0503]|uniref:TorF family putative porin n=1 Tax=Sphingomonas sp. ID0503 TaxID=3399691 RepID=UPI003AFA40AF
MLLSTGPARAQAIAAPGLSIEVASDDRRRGLSWSDGRPALTASGYLPVTGGLDLEAAASTLRGSARHGGADLGIDAGLRYRHDLGGWRLSAGLLGHAFADRSALNYAEVTARAAYQIGPAVFGGSLAYAPRQNAIGGDDLYIAADAELALPGTPWTFRAGAGRSSGETRNGLRAARLRPGGSYWDYHLSAEHVRGPLTAGLRFTATSIDSDEAAPAVDDRHIGSRLTAHLRFDL